MKVCINCKTFEVKSVASYRSHFALCNKGKRIIIEDFSYVLSNFDKVSKGFKKDILLKECNYSCSECGYNKCREDGISILELDHIDGNPTNNKKNNLRILCPNCHALTSTYRNFGNKGNKKTSSRIRKGNVQHEPKDFTKVKEEFENSFIEKITLLFENKEIDFSKQGWVQKLSVYFNETPQVTGRRLRRLMPEFYYENCFIRNYTKYKHLL